MKCLFPFLLYCGLFAFFSCTSRSDELKSKITLMKSTSISLQTAQMNRILPMETVSHTDIKDLKGKYKFVVYSDTSDCSGCYINRLSMWNDLLYLEDSYEDFSFVFIVEARNNENNKLAELIRTCGLKHEVYIDNNLSFRKFNTHIPKEAIFHSFLINKDNNVVIVGDPMYNEHFEKLLVNYLESNCSKRAYTPNFNTCIVFQNEKMESLFKKVIANEKKRHKKKDAA